MSQSSLLPFLCIITKTLNTRFFGTTSDCHTCFRNTNISAWATLEHCQTSIGMSSSGPVTLLFFMSMSDSQNSSSVRLSPSSEFDVSCGYSSRASCLLVRAWSPRTHFVRTFAKQREASSLLRSGSFFLYCFTVGCDRAFERVEHDRISLPCVLLWCRQSRRRDRFSRPVCVPCFCSLLGRLVLGSCSMPCGLICQSSCQS